MPASENYFSIDPYCFCISSSMPSESLPVIVEVWPGRFESDTQLFASRLDCFQGFLELLDVRGRQLRTVDLDRQLVELGGQRERW